MRLLNLWPEGQVVVQPVRRFVLEIVFVLLLVMAITLASWVWINWRLTQAERASQTLQNEWSLLKQQREVEEASMMQMPRFLRQIIAGQLDWMGELPQWTQDGRVRWLSAKVVDDHLLLEGVAQDGTAIEAVAEQIRSRYPKPSLSISEVTDIRVVGQTWWRFSMRIDGVDPIHRWILAMEPVKVEETAPSADRNIRPFISQMWGAR